MGRISSISAFKTNISRYLWNTDKIDHRSISTVIVVPFLLTLLVVGIRLFVFSDQARVPYMLFLLVVLISACYGGSRSSYWASALTFTGGLLLLLLGNGPLAISSGDMGQLFFYFMEVLFLSYLLSAFQLRQKASTIQVNGIEQKKDEILLREQHLIDFVNMATHELKSPVTVLKAYLQLVELRLLKDNQQEYLKFVVKMDAQLGKLLSIITDLLDSTRISSGSLSCTFNRFNLHDSLRECVEGFKASNPDVNIECEFMVSDPVLKGDKDRVDQVLTNFISNAIKYSPSEKKVQVSSMEKDGMVLVRVKDKGMGIPYEQQKDIFSRFYRVKSKGMEKLPGLGLGLFICAEIIKKHQGEIGVESAPGKGSEFWFSLPYTSK